MHSDFFYLKLNRFTKLNPLVNNPIPYSANLSFNYDLSFIHCT